MTVALAGRAPASFEIKSATLPLVSLLLKSQDLSLLATELQARYGDMPDFFDNDPLVVDLTPLQAHIAEAEIDYAVLLPLLHSWRLHPVAARGGSPMQMHAALAAGLAAAPDVIVPTPREATPAPAPAKATAGSKEAARATQPQPDAGASSTTALIIDRPLRSGQQVYARGRDLIVMSMVNAGAEVIADGHIHVYAPLRGRAIAGARGNTEARILSLCLEPELISIAGVYRTSDVPLPPEVLSRPTQIRLVGGTEGKLVMDPIA